jgi:hypothetical protein
MEQLPEIEQIKVASLQPLNAREKSHKEKLDDLVNAYVRFFSVPWKTENILNSESCLGTMTEERDYIHELLHAPTAPPRQKLLAEKMITGRFLTSTLPPLLDNATINNTFSFPVNFNGMDFAAWRNRRFEEPYEVEIAQCRALKKYEDFLNREINKTERASGDTNAKVGFFWDGEEREKEIRRLYNALLKNQTPFISSDGNEDAFHKIFANSAIGKGERIDWISNLGNLVYLFHRLIEKDFILTPDYVSVNIDISKLKKYEKQIISSWLYKKIIICFLRDGKPIENNQLTEANRYYNRKEGAEKQHWFHELDRIVLILRSKQTANSN